EIAISKFRASCLAVLKRVQKSGKSILVTRFGKPMAQIVPVSAAPKSSKRWLGAMKGSMRIAGDIVGPVFDPDDWDVLRD
ncbi:MAG: type II toxin-antitoxin system Phd/YefM family antitoxin, partial [Terriglobales bacterium]